MADEAAFDLGLHQAGIVISEFRRQPPGYCCQLTLPRESPFFDGHFPDNPLLPAAAILTLVAAAFRAAHPDLPLVGFDAVRFSAPVGPGCRARLTFHEPSSGAGSMFELATDDEILASGRIRHGEPRE